MSRLFNTEFVEGFKKSFCEAVIEQSFQSEDSLYGKDLMSLTASKQFNFFVMKILFKKWQEEIKQLESPYFDYKAPEVRKAMVQFMNVLSQNIKIDAQGLRPILEAALDNSLLLAVNPADFIREEFSGRENITYASKHSKPTLKYLKILKEEFEDFFNSQAHGTYKEVFEIADDYFADVALEEAQETLFRELSSVRPISLENLLADDELLDITSFEDELEDPLEEEEEEAIEMEIPTDLQSDPPTQVAEESLESAEESNVEEVVLEDEEPEEVILEEDEPKEVIPENEVLAVARQESEPTINEHFETSKDESLAEHLEKEEKVDSIFSSISVNQRYMFTQELFSGDANEFQSAIGGIDSFDTFDDSVEHLVSNFAKKYNWNMNSDEVKELLKVIFRKFR